MEALLIGGMCTMDCVLAVFLDLNNHCMIITDDAEPFGPSVSCIHRFVFFIYETKKNNNT